MENVILLCSSVCTINSMVIRNIYFQIYWMISQLSHDAVLL